MAEQPCNPEIHQALRREKAVRLCMCQNNVIVSVWRKSPTVFEPNTCNG